MIKILKASAGSGKTFRLTGKYLELLLREDDPRAFRHILAVTFTNKATGEMKSRILRELHTLSRTPESSGYLSMFVPAVVPDASVLKEKASRILVEILHDYSAFAVSTIDKFFQQTLRAFAREVGQFSPYQIELERKPLIHEAVDRILDSVTEEDEAVLAWLNEKVLESLSKGEKPGIDKPLYDMAEDLGRLSVDREELSSANLSAVKEECDALIRRFAVRLTQLDGGHFPEPVLTEKIIRPGEKDLKTMSPDVQAHFRDGYKMYLTAWTIRERLWSLGIAKDFFETFDSLLAEKNVMCLDDSNALLKKIIDDCEAPFVYEKTGIRYEHFLLDEFQDTSTVQWDNFLPLLRESESNARESLVVGDVKQSIYRWRGSDWKLLDSGLAAQFPDSLTEHLQSNWRSCRAVVEFNNAFFTYAAGILNLSDAYSDVKQTPCSGDPGEGSVKVDFVPKGEIETAVLASIRSAQSAGASLKDITILVRDNKAGALMASFLTGSGIPVVTDDSLNLKSSVMVRRLVSLLTCMENPENSIAAFSASSLGIGIPEHFHSLTDLAEGLLGELTLRFPDAADAEVLYLQSFMDCLQDWTTVYGNNLPGFLRYWKDADPCISSPTEGDSIRIMTVHKAKGLEFPYVIFPYAEKVTLYRGSFSWTRPSLSVSGDVPPDGSIGRYHYPVTLAGTLADTYFEKDLRGEQAMQKVDNLNIFYVALTRAVASLHIIASEPSKACQAAADKGKETFDFKNLSQILYFWCRKHGYAFGRPYDFTGTRKENAPADAGSRIFNCRYVSYPLAEGLRVRREDQEEDEPRREGTILHAILSEVNGLEDVAYAVDAAVSSGELPVSAREESLSMLSAAVSSRPEWFPGRSDGVRSVREVSVFAPDGTVQRPDRVILSGGEVVVVDYKFGYARRAEYVSQVRRYVELYRALGHREVSGYVWYIRTGDVVKV